MIVLVTGGREYTNTKKIFSVLSRLHAERTFTYLVHGDAKGTDHVAHRWCKHVGGVQPVAMEALWDIKGFSAGTKRNQAMWDLLNPSLCVAFPGGTGTANMMRIAFQGGAELIDVDDHDWDQVEPIVGVFKK